MKNNPKLLLYIAAAFITYLLWQRWVEVNRPPVQPTVASAPAAADIPNAAPGSDVPAATSATPQRHPRRHPGRHHCQRRRHPLKTDVLELDIASKGGTIIRADLPAYPETKNGGKPLALLHTENPGRFLLQSGLTSSDSKAPSHLDTFSSTTNSYTLADGQDTLAVPLTWQENGITVNKTYTFKRGAYDFALEQKIQNDSDKAWRGNAYQQWVFGQPAPSKGLGQVATFTGAVMSYDDDPYEKIKLGTAFETQSQTGWVAMIQHYFLGAIVPPQGQPTDLLQQKTTTTAATTTPASSAPRAKSPPARAPASPAKSTSARKSSTT